VNFNIQIDTSKEVLLKINIEDIQLIERMIQSYLKVKKSEISKTNTVGEYYILKMEFDHITELIERLKLSAKAYDCGYLTGI
jgi:hypothetical protein